ncbi:MAG: glycoside hydrolase family protein [Elusimicrobiaceae bacterium]|nr:glycoside hydrolase family protein [Elusimicrobiaceae bacterium]
MIEKWLQYTQRYEGLNVMPYKCPAGHWTIGYGHNLENGISKEAAQFILLQDVNAAQKAVRQQFEGWCQLGEVRQFVLVDMCFNMGIGKLAAFKKMWAALKRGDYTATSYEMLDSRWAGQVGRRARELAEMMRTGEYL